MAVVKESTKKFWQLQGENASGLLRIFNMIHGYLYYTIYDHYVIGASTILRWLGRHPDWSMTPKVYKYLMGRYHCKVMVPQEMEKLLKIDQDIVVPQQVAKKVVPFELANKIIMKNFDQLALVDCPCRLEKAAMGRNPCQPINTCLFFGKIGVDFVTTHMPRMHARRVKQDEALAQLHSNAEKGYAFTIWSKDATGYRSGVLCSCCSCCCFGTEVERMARKIPGLGPLNITAPSGYSVVTDMSKCKADGACTVCPYLARELVETDGKKKLVYHYELCMGCGACVQRCPHGAIQLVRDEKKGVPFDVQMLQEQARARQ